MESLEGRDLGAVSAQDANLDLQEHRDPAELAWGGSSTYGGTCWGHPTASQGQTGGQQELHWHLTPAGNRTPKTGGESGFLGVRDTQLRCVVLGLALASPRTSCLDSGEWRDELKVAGTASSQNGASSIPICEVC